MNYSDRLRLKFSSFRFRIANNLIKVKWLIWNKRIKLWLDRRQKPKNEFDQSLDKDLAAMLVMSPQELQAYDLELARRRLQAHERDFEH